MHTDRVEHLELAGMVAKLREQLKHYPVAAEHYIADHVLFGLAIDVMEHAIAVQLLRSSEVPRAAFANARAAFESAQDVLYLTSESAEYDRLGCLARAHEVHEDVRLRARANRANVEAGLDHLEEKSAAAILAEDAAAWDGLAPGCGDALRSALNEFLSRPSGQRKHWTGLSREEIARQVAIQINADPGVGSMFDAMYGGLSAHSHPRMRTSHRSVEQAPDGALIFVGKGTDKIAPAGAAVLACAAALAALGRRRGFFASST